MDIRLLLFGLLVFCAALLLVWGIYGTFNDEKGQQAERVARRLRNAIGEGGGELAVSITKERMLSADPRLHQLLQKMPGAQALDRLLMQSGRGWNLARLLVTMAVAGLCGLLGALFLSLPWLACLGSMTLLGALPVMALSRTKSRRLASFEAQLPEALDMMSRAMRAGHAFPTALKMIGEEMPAPLSTEFRAVFDEVNFGVAMPTALMSLAIRVPSTDLRYFVIAVLIQRETGGNLTELLTSISAIIRDRIKLLAQVRVMSAEGKMSAWVLGALPFGAGALMYLSNNEFLTPMLEDPFGRKMLGISLLLMLVGVLLIRKITSIRV